VAFSNENDVNKVLQGEFSTISNSTSVQASLETRMKRAVFHLAFTVLNWK